MSKFCTNCGNELEEKVNFCVNCGYSAKDNLNNNTTNKITKQNTFTPKNKIVAGLLGIFLGCFGVHNFYLGYNGKAVAQLLLTLLTSGLLSAVSAIWGLIEGIMILIGNINTDANGNPLKD